MPAQEKNQTLEEIAKLLKSTVDELAGRASFIYSQDPELKEKDVIEYNSRMRIVGMEKFNNPCFLAAVSLYRNAGDQKAHRAIGSMAIYLEKEKAQKILKAFGYPVSLEAEDVVILETTGTMCADILKLFMDKLNAKGYSGIVASKVSTYENTMDDGLEFEYSQYRYYEITFFSWKEKVLVLDLTFAAK